MPKKKQPKKQSKTKIIFRKKKDGTFASAAYAKRYPKSVIAKRVPRRKVDPKG